MVYIYLKYATTSSLQVGNFLVGGAAGGGVSDVTVEWISKRESQFYVCFPSAVFPLCDVCFLYLFLPIPTLW